MRCPKCGTKTQVKKRVHKVHKTFRYRQCPKCKYNFRTVEMTDLDWNYKSIVTKIQEILKDVR